MPATPATGSSSSSPTVPQTPQNFAGKVLNNGLISKKFFSGTNLIVLLCTAFVILAVAMFFIGLPAVQQMGKLKTVGELAPPINVADVNFPSDFQRQIFLKNFQDAGKTRDYQERYKLLQDDYSRLLGFYTGDHDAKTRKVLEQYAQYMIISYPEHAQESIYTVPCFDSGCGTAKYPDEIKKIKGEVDSSSIDGSVKESLDKNFEAAALSSNKNFQWSAYVDVLSAVKSAYDKNKDEPTLAIYKELSTFIDKNYPDFKVPQILRMAQ